MRAEVDLSDLTHEMAWDIEDSELVRFVVELADAVDDPQFTHGVISELVELHAKQEGK
ncbi:hypothetical protein AB0C87_25180 [Actinomadura sp. NPDC048021]|uniref:hypothetical protein n=1 Tax=Actinomadura sp. NPDC048021 TaxID=3155385 RepID=UPI003406C26B